MRGADREQIRAIARVRAGTSNDFVTYVDEEIEPGKSYTYSVRAYNSDGGRETSGTSLPDRKIVDGAFMACRKLRQVVLPERLRTMGKFAFAICEELRDVVFDPDEEIEVIPERAFCYCKSLSVLTLPEHVTTIGKRAFWGCTELTRINGNILAYFPMKLNKDYAFEKTEEAEKKVFHVPEGVTRIAPYAFFECGLEQIFLPSTLTEVSDHAFTRSGAAPDAGVLTDYYKMRSLAGDRSLYRAEDFAGYSDISGKFKEWCEDYIAANRAVLPMESGISYYTTFGVPKKLSGS